MSIVAVHFFVHSCISAVRQNYIPETPHCTLKAPTVVEDAL